MCRKNRPYLSGIAPTTSTAGITPGFVSVRSGTAWGIVPRWKPVARTGLSNDRNNSWSYSYDASRVARETKSATEACYEQSGSHFQQRVFNRRHVSGFTFHDVSLRSRRQPQSRPRPALCGIVRIGGSCGGTKTDKRIDHSHGRTTSNAGGLPQHDLRSRGSKRTGGTNRPGTSLRTYGVQGHEDGRDEGLRERTAHSRRMVSSRDRVGAAATRARTEESGETGQSRGSGSHRRAAETIYGITRKSGTVRGEQ